MSLVPRLQPEFTGTMTSDRRPYLRKFLRETGRGGTSKLVRRARDSIRDRGHALAHRCDPNSGPQPCLPYDTTRVPFAPTAMAGTE
jgi:hypothetical protein